MKTFYFVKVTVYKFGSKAYSQSAKRQLRSYTVLDVIGDNITSPGSARQEDVSYLIYIRHCRLALSSLVVRYFTMCLVKVLIKINYVTRYT